MYEEKLVSIVRDFAEAYAKRDVEKMLSFLTEDVVWVALEGTFKGNKEVKRYLTWEAQITTQRNTQRRTRARDAGIGIMVKGNKAAYEWVIEVSTSDGRRLYEVSGISVYEFNGEKIQKHGMYYDRLSTAKQMAKGWFEKMIVGTIVNRMEKGLH